jgi:hypothetical protein
MIPMRLEEGAVRFVREHQVQGRLFNDMDNGCYFHFRFKEDLPLFIDNLNAYTDDLMRNYFDILRGNRRSHQLLDGYGVNVVLLVVGRLQTSVLATKLDADPEWARVYADADAVIWVRRAEFAELIAEVGPVRTIPFASLEALHGSELVPGDPSRR